MRRSASNKLWANILLLTVLVFGSLYFDRNITHSSGSGPDSSEWLN